MYKIETGTERNNMYYIANMVEICRKPYFSDLLIPLRLSLSNLGNW